MEAYAEAVSGGKRPTWVPLKDMPATPQPAKTARALESHERISVGSKESSADELQTTQLWHNIKQGRMAKEEEGIKKEDGCFS